MMVVKVVVDYISHKTSKNLTVARNFKDPVLLIITCVQNIMNFLTIIVW